MTSEAVTNSYSPVGGVAPTSEELFSDGYLTINYDYIPACVPESALATASFLDVGCAYPDESMYCYMSAFEGGWHEELDEEFGESADFADLCRWWMRKRIEGFVEADEYFNSKRALILLRRWQDCAHPTAEDGAPILEVHGPMDFSRFEGTSWGEAVHQDAAGRTRAFETEMHERGAAAVPKQLSPLLTSLGVPHTTSDLRGHAHGAHSAISAHVLLDKVFPKLVGDVLVVNAKKAKLEKYQGCAPNARLFLENPRFEMKDEDRYRGTAAWLGDCPAPTGVWLECAQFVTDLQIGRALAASPACEQLLITGIACPEVTKDVSSLWPEIAELRYESEGRATYLLEGLVDGQYPVHKSRELNTLQPRDVCVVGPDYCVRFKYAVVESVMNHVVILVRPIRDASHAALVLPTFRYSRVGWTEIPDVFVSGSAAHSNRGRLLLPTNLLLDVINYLPTLNEKTQNVALHAKIDNMKKSPQYAAFPGEMWERLYHVGVALRSYKFGDAGESLFDVGVLKAILLPIIYGFGRWCWKQKWHLLESAVLAALPHMMPGRVLRMLAHVAVAAKQVFEVWNGDLAATKLALAKGLAWEFLPKLPVLLIELGLVAGTAIGWRLYARRAKLDLYMQMVANEWACVYEPCQRVVLDGEFQTASNLLDFTESRDISEDPSDFDAAKDQPPYINDYVSRSLPVDAQRLSASAYADELAAQARAETMRKAKEAVRANSDQIAQSKESEVAEVGALSSDEAAGLEDVAEQSTSASKGKERATGGDDEKVEIENSDEDSEERTIPTKKVKYAYDAWAKTPASWHTEGQERVDEIVAQESAAEEERANEVGTSRRTESTGEVEQSETVVVVVEDADGELMTETQSLAPLGEVETEVVPPAPIPAEVPAELDSEMIDSEYTLPPADPLRPFNSVRVPGTDANMPDSERVAHTVSFQYDGEFGGVSAIEEDRGKAISLPVLFGIAASLFLNATQAWCVMKPGVLGEPPYTGQCAVRAFAVLVGRKPEGVWADLCDLVPCATLEDWTEHGAPRAAFELMGVLHGVKLDLLGANGLSRQTLGSAKARSSVGAITYDKVNKHYVVSAINQKPRVPKLQGPPKPRAPPRAKLSAFLKAMDAFKDEHGEPVPGEWKTYTADPKRAAQFMKELADGRVGLMSKLEGERYVKDLAKKLEKTVKSSGARSAQVRMITGYNGCSKTSPIAAFLATRAQDAKEALWMTVAPRVPIREDLYKKIGPRGEPSRHNTFENGLTRYSEFCLIDELALFPPGYLDAMILLQTAKYFFIAHDPSQCLYNNPNPLTQLNSMVAEGLYVAKKLGSEYWYWSHRTPQILSIASGVPSSNPEQGFVQRITGAYQNMPMICSTTARVNQKRSEKYDAYSCSGIQGREYPYIQFLLDTVMLTTVSARDIWTACCRVTKGIYLIAADASATNANIQSHVVFGALFKAMSGQASFSYEKLAGESLRGLTIVRRDEMVKRVRRARYESLTEETRGKSEDLPVHPAEKMPMAMRSLYHPVALKEFGHVDPVENLAAIAEGVCVDLPIMDDDVLKASITPEFAARAEREFINHLGMSKCYDDVAIPDEDAYLFPRMRSNDGAFAAATFEKRIKASTVLANEKAYLNGKETGVDLFLVTQRALGVPVQLDFDEDLWYQCLDEQITARIEGRASGLIEQYEERSVAWLKDFSAKVRVKGQLKAKLEALAYPEPKAGQTINVLPEWVIATFGVWCRYILAQIRRTQTNPHVHIFGGESLSDFSQRVRKHWRKDPNLTADQLRGCTINDFTAFGSSQGGESVTMDLCWFRWCSMPESLCDLYVGFKTKLLALGAIKVICRDDGEPGTYLFNSLYDIGNTAAKFSPMALWLGYWLFGGDDMATDHIVAEHPTWHTIWKRRVRTISKLQYVDEADFCGWILLEDHGILRDPLVIYFKIRGRDAHGFERSDYLPGYAAELRYTYWAVQHGAVLAPLTLVVLQRVISLIHKLFPVLSALHYAAGSMSDRLAALRRRIEYWETHSFKGRKAVLKVARAAEKRETRGFRVDLPVLTSRSKFIETHFNPLSHTNMPADLATTAVVAKTATDANVVTAPASVIGDSWDGNVRVFAIKMGSLTLKDSDKDRTLLTFTQSQRLHSATHIANYIQFSPRAVVTGARFEVQFGRLCKDADVKITTAVYSADDTAPATESDFFNLASCHQELLAPRAAGGVPPSYARDLFPSIGSYGVSRQLKPRPVVSGLPIVVINYAVSIDAPLGKDKVGLNLGNAVLYVEVTRF
uniref:Replicase n=1 Tax=Agaricus bisporus virus 12 TaxID=1945742 RepID=A0A1Q1N6K8_9VIRU|nr:replicase [Agaricus bisporus virus 12]